MSRDLRDPQKITEYLESIRVEGQSLRDAYDRCDGVHHPSFAQVLKHESMGTQTAAEYRRELEQREDLYAKAALRDIEAGKGVQGYDDAG